MGRSTVSIAVLAIGLLCLAPYAHASEEVGSPPTASLRIYGAYLPERVDWDDTHWGHGIVARTALSAKWGLDVGAARFTSAHRALTPMTIGFAYGPEARYGPRPWVEFGVGLYRLESTTSPAEIAPLSSEGGLLDPGTPVDLERRRGPRRNNAGGYLGVGFDVPLSDRVGFGVGVRIHGWSYPDALIALQTGLSFGF